MTNPSPLQADAKFTGKHMALIMVTFFGIIISVNFTMAFLASNSWTGLVVKNSYVASQKFNDELRQAKAQAASGIHSDLAYFDGTLVFALKNKQGERLLADDMIAEIGRPAFEQADQVLNFVPGPETTYKLRVSLAEGLWALKITGQLDDAPYRRDVRLYVDAQGNGRVE